jgi:hypothetical protein
MTPAGGPVRGGRQRLVHRHQVRADDLAMQGFNFVFRGLTPENAEEAKQRFEAALREDPRSLRAWAGVATVAGQTGSLNWMPREAAIARLEEAALHLQQLDQDDYYTGMSRSFIAFLKGDWENQLVVATLLAQRFKSHPYPFAEYSKRDPAYRASSIGTFLRGSDPRFIAGRDLAIETLRELGLP